MSLSLVGDISVMEGLERGVKEMPQLELQTEHVLHGGMYARTVRLEPGNLIVGVRIKVQTIVIVNGWCKVFTGASVHTIEGFQVVAAAAGRKTAFVALGPTEITMILATDAKTIEEAEEAFTDEPENLLSRRLECQA